MTEDFNGQLLLVEIHTKLKGLIDRFDIVSQGDGSPGALTETDE